SCMHPATAGVPPGDRGACRPDPLLVNITSRPAREVRAWLAKDPIDLFRRTLTQFGLLADEQAMEREQAAKAKAEEAFRLAEAAPVPQAEDALRNVFASGTVEPRHIVS